MLLPEVRAALAHAGRIEDTAKRAGRGELGSLAVGFVGSASYTVVPEIIRRFGERYPEVELTLQEMSSAEQARALNDGLLEVGFLRPPVGGEGEYLAVRVVVEEPLVAILPDSHRLAGKDSIDLGELSKNSFVLFPRRLGLSFYDLAVEACRGAGFEPVVGQEAASMQTIVGLVAAGAGVSLVPTSVAKVRGTGVAYRTLKGESPPARIGAAWRKGNSSHTVGVLLGLVEEFGLA